MFQTVHTTSQQTPSRYSLPHGNGHQPQESHWPPLPETTPQVLPLPQETIPYASLPQESNSLSVDSTTGICMSAHAISQQTAMSLVFNRSISHTCNRTITLPLGDQSSAHYTHTLIWVIPGPSRGSATGDALTTRSPNPGPPSPFFPQQVLKGTLESMC